MSQSLECQTCGEEVKGLTSGWASYSHPSAFITKHCNLLLTSGQCCYMAGNVTVLAEVMAACHTCTLTAWRLASECESTGL